MLVVALHLVILNSEPLNFMKLVLTLRLFCHDVTILIRFKVRMHFVALLYIVC